MQERICKKMIWWIIAAICAFFVKGLCGFGNTVVFTTILSFGNNNINISPVDLILGYPSNAILLWRERRAVKWKICIPLAVLVIVSSIPGMVFLKNFNATIIKIIFGFVIICIGIEMLFRETGEKKTKQSKVVLVLIGFLSGLLCGLYGIGALLSAYVSRVTDDIHSFKANMCFVFLAENTFRLIMYSVLGIITFQTVKQAIVLIPFMFFGLALGIFSNKFLDEKWVKRIVIIMLIISGAALVINSCMLYLNVG